MAVTLADGTTVAIASAYAAALPFTAASNASESVLTMAATTGLANGDYVEVTSTWGMLTGRLVRIKGVTGTTVTLEQIDTTDSSRFAGSGFGSVRKVTTWTQLTQLTKDFGIEGGDQQYADVSVLEDRNDRKLPTTRAAMSARLGAYFDPTTPWVPIVRSVSDLASVAGFRFIWPNNSRTVGSAYWSFQEIPTVTDKTLRVKMDLTFAAQPVTYPT